MPRRLTLHVDAPAYAEILLEAVATFPMETGGLLLGTWHAKDVASVAEVVGPGPDAEHAASSFEPDADWQRAELADAWRRHAGAIEYLGDWHTHPNGTPNLSALDREALTTIAEHPAARAPRPWMVILVIDDAGRTSLHARCLTGTKLLRARVSTKVRHA